MNRRMVRKGKQNKGIVLLSFTLIIVIISVFCFSFSFDKYLEIDEQQEIKVNYVNVNDEFIVGINFTVNFINKTLYDINGTEQVIMNEFYNNGDSIIFEYGFYWRFLTENTNVFNNSSVLILYPPDSNQIDITLTGISNSTIVQDFDVIEEE